MELFKNMKISTKLVTLTGILGALVVVTAVCCLYLLSSVSEQYQKVFDEDAYAATLATQAGKLFTESRNEYTRFLTRVDPMMRQESMANMQKCDRELDVVLGELEKRVISTDAKKVMSDIRGQIDTFREKLSSCATVRKYLSTRSSIWVNSFAGVFLYLTMKKLLL